MSIEQNERKNVPYLIAAEKTQSTLGPLTSILVLLSFIFVANPRNSRLELSGTNDYRVYHYHNEAIVFPVSRMIMIFFILMTIYM